MINHLVTFYNNKGEREAVKAFMLQNLSEIAVELAFDGKSVAGIPEAKKCVDKAFDKLDELYGKIETPKEVNSR